MRAGRLRHRLILQSKTTAQDSYGAAVVSWSTEATVWGSIEPLTGREYFSQQQVQAESKVRIVMRYRSDIDTTWRVKHDGLYYDIEDVQNENTRDRMLILMVREGVSEDTGTETGDTFTVLDSDGNSFSPTTSVLDSDGNSFTVSTSVLDSDGNSFAVA